MSLPFGKIESSRWAKWKYVFRQFRVRPSPDQADNNNARAYSLPSWYDAYAGSAMNGLHESEVFLCDRYFHPGQALLDVGCGGGREAFGFAQRGLRVTGIDVCTRLIASACKIAEKLPRGAPNFCVGSLSALDFPPASFDVIYLASDIYAGIPGRRNRVNALAQCRGIVRPGGFVIFPVKLSPPDSIPAPAAKRVHPSIAAEPYGREMLLVHLENGNAFALNETAHRMWQLVADGCSAREVAERLAGQFETSRERLEADAAELIRQLEAEAILRS